jgi:4,5-DOPA dioxygenase extradiol
MGPAGAGMQQVNSRWPAVFLGHGSPINAVLRNRYTEAWTRIGTEIPRPKAVLCISAHWFTSGSALTINTAPETIHDFGGFPRELYQVRYPAPGAPDLARRIQGLLAPVPAELSEEWGLDHGTWSVLRHIYPHADVPVVQLSIDATRAAPFHYDIGRRLAPLREEGVLILGSGNIVHNLYAYAREGAERFENVKPLPWAANFESTSRELMLAGDYAQLIYYQKLGRDAMLSIPTPEHYLPLLYVLGAAAESERERISFPIQGIDGGSVSMLAVQIG